MCVNQPELKVLISAVIYDALQHICSVDVICG